jgi:hypothetical protein
MLFGRGQWAVFGVEPTSLEAFQTGLSSTQLDTFLMSQLASSIITKFQNTPTVGINPYSAPRLDEKLTNTDVISKVAEFLALDEEAMQEGGAITDSLSDYFGSESSFSLGNNKYGMWVVLNEHDDLTDPNSKKEQVAYDNMERPFKFLGKEEKKSVEATVTAQGVISRRQFPVLVDFQHGYVYAGTANAEEILVVRSLLTKAGAKPFSLRWDFGTFNWPQLFLNKMYEETHFAAEMKTRADEMTRFRPDEIEKLEDKQMEKIVSNFFALAELDNELWVGLTTPARVRIYKISDPVATSNPSLTFSLLHMTNDAEISASSVVFQEVCVKTNKAGDEKTYRNDLYTFDINDNLCSQDSGAALLRGFDLPQFKREIKATIKAKGHASIADFWYMWLQGMHDAILYFVENITSVLEIDKEKYGLVPFDEEGEVEERKVEVE